MRSGSPIISARSRGTIKTSIGFDAHDPQGVDFLPHLHRAEFGGKRRARAARHHDRGQQHAEFAQDEEADEVDHEGRRAEALQLEDALLGDDAPDQERDQHDDRHAAERDLFQLVDQGRKPEMLRPRDDAHERRDDLAKKADAARKIPPGVDHGPSHVGQELHAAVAADDRQRLKAPISDLVEQDAMLGARADEVRAQAALAHLMSRPVEHPGAERIEALDLGKVDEHARPLAPCGVGDFGDARLDGRRLVGRPPSRQLGQQLMTGALDGDRRATNQYALRHGSTISVRIFRGDSLSRACKSRPWVFWCWVSLSSLQGTRKRA